MAPYLHIILPSILIIIVFFLRAFIDKECDIPHLISCIIWLPLDIVVLALSFLVAYVIGSNYDGRAAGTCYLLIGFLILVITVFLSRRSECSFQRNKKIKLVLFLLLNLFISIYCIFCCIRLLISLNTK